MIIKRGGISRQLAFLLSSSRTSVFRSIRKPISSTLASIQQKNCYRPVFKLHCSTMSTERHKADAATAPATNNDSPTLFDKIISKEIPTTIVYEDDRILAFRDVNPQAPVHILLIPKQKNGLSQLAKAHTSEHASILGHLLLKAAEVARNEKLDNGYRIVINDGKDGCQSVYHLHVHLMGGRKLNWPPG